MFFVHFYEFPVNFSGCRGSERVLGALLGGQGAVVMQKNVKKNNQKTFSKTLLQVAFDISLSLSPGQRPRDLI